MRELKFRAWDNEKKKMLYNLEVCSMNLGENLNDRGLWDENITLPLEQFTGKNDKKGVEIYTGDKITIYGNKTFVSHNGTRFGKGKTCIPFRDYDWKYVKITGNIHEGEK